MWNVLSFILFSVGVAPALLISNFFCSRDYTSCHHVIFFFSFSDAQVVPNKLPVMEVPKQKTDAVLFGTLSLLPHFKVYTV
jgi:hypothetical protein